MAYPDKRPVSLSVDVPPSSSPFPSPSSSFIPPPTPDAHEFAMKPPPAGRASRKSSVVPNPAPTDLPPSSPHNYLPNGTSLLNGNTSSPASPATPPPSDSKRPSFSANRIYKQPSSPSQTATPIANIISLPDSQVTAPTTPSFASSSTSSVPLSHPPTTPSSPTSHFSMTNGTSNPLDTPSSTRPAPASPVISRRVSQAPSTSSARSKSSLPPSAPVSRSNSTRKHHSSSSNTNVDSVAPNFTRLSTQLQNITNLTMSNITSGTPPVSSPTTSFAFVPPSAAQAAGAVVSTVAKQSATYVKIRDFAFPVEDERHFGLGADVPRANKAAQLNRALGTGRRTDAGESWESMSDDGDMEDDDDDMESSSGAFGHSTAMGGFQFGVGRMSFHAGQAGGMNGFPSKTDLDRNFLGDEPVEDHDDDEDDDEVEEDLFFDFEPDEVDGDESGESGDEADQEQLLYPGLYRALFAFEPEGTAEMALEEDQVVRVIGRGGGVGWAVVVDDRDRGSGGEVDGKPKLALVPESYLEPVRLDGVTG